MLMKVGLISAGVVLLSQVAVMADAYVGTMKTGVGHYHHLSPRGGAPPQKATIPDLTQLGVGTAYQAQNSIWHQNMWITSRYLGRLWAKTGSLSGLMSALFQATLPQNGTPPAEAGAGPGADTSTAPYPAGSGGLRKAMRLPMTNRLGYCFPVAYPFSFRNSWGDWRSGGRLHRAVDIFAREGTPVYAVTSGVIQTLTSFPEAGITLLLRGHDLRGYGYMHLQGYAPGIAEGKPIKAGELIGFVGRTGLQNSEAHLHFQVYADNRMCRDELLNPYGFLVLLCHGLGVTDLQQYRTARIYSPPQTPDIKLPGTRPQILQR